MEALQASLQQIEGTTPPKKPRQEGSNSMIDFDAKVISDAYRAGECI
ncbi:MAG: hypothetical protein ACLUOI_26280 [Eisenbergiella sp.]